MVGLEKKRHTLGQFSRTVGNDPYVHNIYILFKIYNYHYFDNIHDLFSINSIRILPCVWHP